MNLTKTFLFCLCIFAMSCAKKESVDLLVVNAKLYTVDPSGAGGTAFAVHNGRFVAIGESAALIARYRALHTIDAGGKAITPGIIDAHCHFYGLGQNQQIVDLVGTKSYQEVLDRVVAFNDEKPTAFIRGRGWDQNDWEVKEYPTKEALDALFPNTPVALERVDGHAYLVNQAALDLAGIHNNTVVSGGSIEKKGGVLIGILVDNPMALVDAVMPVPSISDKITALKDAERIAVSYGLTTVNDAGLNRDIIEIIDSLQKTGDLKIRLYAMVSNSKENLDYFLPKGIIETPRLRVGSIKVYADGALGSRGATLKEAYSDRDGHFGSMVTPIDEIEALAKRLAETDYQMNTHAIGDSANIAVLRAYTTALKGKKDKRWKVEHAQIISLEDFDYFSTGIIPSVQPTHATSDMYWAEDRLGAKRMQGAYAFKTLLNKAGTIALGTDFPVEQVSPFLTFLAATARQDTAEFPKGGFQVQEALTREETLKGMTLWAAHSNFQEMERGSISVGKMADFVIYNTDMMVIPLSEVPKVTVQQTYIDGQLVYKK
ncbi:MAG: putative amidohydrolase YtcJ [Arcticibacterium sp.]|jgi:predicted amidohydrolase YtcJ